MGEELKLQRLLRRYHKREDASSADFAFQPDFSSMHLDERFRDR